MQVRVFKPALWAPGPGLQHLRCAAVVGALAEEGTARRPYGSAAVNSADRQVSTSSNCASAWAAPAPSTSLLRFLGGAAEAAARAPCWVLGAAAAAAAWLAVLAPLASVASASSAWRGQQHVKRTRPPPVGGGKLNTTYSSSLSPAYSRPARVVWGRCRGPPRAWRSGRRVLAAWRRAPACPEILLAGMGFKLDVAGALGWAQGRAPWRGRALGGELPPAAAELPLGGARAGLARSRASSPSTYDMALTTKDGRRRVPVWRARGSRFKASLEFASVPLLLYNMNRPSGEWLERQKGPSSVGRDSDQQRTSSPAPASLGVHPSPLGHPPQRAR